MNGHLTPAQAAKLRGRLGFSQSMLFGRTGRALLNSSSERQCSKVTGRFHPLNEGIILSLNWWLHALEYAEPRRTMLAPPKPALVYCDASGIGHIGFVAISQGEVKVGHSHLPPWVLELAGIYEFELISAIFALHAVSLLWPGLPIILCTDNAGAASTLVRGNCSSPLGGVLASTFGPRWHVFVFRCGSRRFGRSSIAPIPLPGHVRCSGARPNPCLPAVLGCRAFSRKLPNRTIRC